MGPLRTNCYLFLKEKNCLIFDPGAEGNKLVQYIKEQALNPLAILLTHGHFDHIEAIDDVRNAFGIPCYVHQGDSKCLYDSNHNLGNKWLSEPLVLKRAEHVIEKEESIKIGDFKLEIIHTPGHSRGSVCYFDAETRTLFSGDTLFNRAIGRTDLPTSNESQIYESIVNKLFKLPDDTLVLPGHGPETTILDEKEKNPFLKHLR
ncbi:MAG: hypothetical protein K0R71_1093 [Bacillales bacterium]|nr:hypothetical protein [Bacillales bacterium]